MLQVQRLKTAPWARQEPWREYADRRPWCFPPTPWIRGRVTQPEHALTCSPHSWRAGRRGGACNMTLPPDKQMHNTQHQSLCTNSLHGQHTSSFRHVTLQSVKLRQDTQLTESVSPELQHKERWNQSLTRINNFSQALYFFLFSLRSAVLKLWPRRFQPTPGHLTSCQETTTNKNTYTFYIYIYIFLMNRSKTDNAENIIYNHWALFIKTG